jgi:isopropylmalate/homocitrate/citramalate synthase
VTGTRLFDVESGIISTWIRNVRDVDLTESFPYLPELVGQSEVSLVLGKGSGLDSIIDALERVGMTATPEKTAEILVEVKAVSLERKSLIELEEFESIARRVIARVPATTS